ncbi:MAG: hypothetical protein CW338_12320, partial [Clostridiales bacterium]|nr:hypothetical protein [Clostridiales bacterium]
MLICDTHCDTLYTLAMHPGRKTDLTPERLKKGGVSLQTMAMFVGGSREIGDIAAAYEKMRAKIPLLETEWNLRRVKDPADAREGENAFMLSVEGCDLLGGEKGPGLIEEWRDMGLRMAAPTRNYENIVGVPACVDQDAGLKKEGRAIVKLLLQAGIAADVSHLSRRGVFDLLDMGVKPLASHSCCSALCDHPRNLTDEQLKALFEAGGYVGINFYPAFLRGKKADLQDIVRHAQHMLEMGGEGKIGFGSDFDGIETKPAGLDNPEDLPALLDALRKGGISGECVRGMAGENLLQYY